MAVYFDHPIQTAGLGAALTHHNVEWHRNFAVLAVASKNESTDADGCVNLYLDEGELVEDASIHRSAVVECMQWHPSSRIIAVGWRSGEITTYNDHDHEVFEQSSIHRSPVRFLCWNQNGARLISGDKSGLIVVWKVDGRGQLHPAPLHQHRLLAPLTHCTLHQPRNVLGKSLPGDGSVLDAYSWGRKSTAISSTTTQDPITCFFATADGVVYFLANSGEHQECFRAEGAVHSLLLLTNKQILAVVTQDMVLTQFSVSIGGQITQIMTAKLSGKNKATSIIWVAEGVLASCSDESIVRLWDFDRGDNYVLQHTLSAPDEVVTSVSYNFDKGILAGGTSSGNVILWQWKGGCSLGPSSSTGLQSDGAERWELLATSALIAPILQVKWGSRKNLLAANSGSTVKILTEHVMNTHFNEQTSAVQVSPSEVLVECHSTGLVHTIKTDIHISGIFVTKEYVMVWSGKKLAVYAISQDKLLVRVAGSFTTEAQTAAIYEHSVYSIEKNQIHVRTLQGTVKQLLSCSEQEGSPVVLSVSKHFLVAGTDTGHVKMWDLSRREPKVLCSKRLPEEVPECAEVISVRCNCSGTRISIITEKPDSEGHLLALLDVESESIKVLNPAVVYSQACPDVEPSEISATDVSLPDLSDATLGEQLQLCSELLGRQPVSHHWDCNETRALVVEMTAGGDGGGSLKGRKGGKRGESWEELRAKKARANCKYSQSGVVAASLFVSQDLSVLISEVAPMESSYNSLIGFHVPFLYFSRKTVTPPSLSQEAQPSSPTPHAPTTVARVTLQDFIGLESSDPATLQAMMEFSYHSTVGNMDEAFKAIKLIKSESVWENMARMCVKTQRLDVAAVCLGNMGNARAARAIREARDIPEPEARLAVLAIQLGMLEEAEELYKKSKRYDLLNQFYQASGHWTKAIEVSELTDRMHLKTTYYSYAKHTEALGEYSAAIASYEKSETHQFEVPRMLLDDPLELENYVMKSKDREIRKWWAEYLESMGEWEQAMQFYETAKDHYSLVRILCFNGNLERAVEVAEESGSRAAAYHLARRLSMENEDVRRAIHFYTKAQCYTPAIQLAKEHGLENELMNLALLSSQQDMIEAAKYYEDNPSTQDKAILLYHKAGEISRALELCFQHRQFDVLHQVAEDLNDEASPEIISRVTDYFLEHGQFEKAVELLVKSKRLGEALDLCVANSVTITEELAERISIPKRPNEAPAETERRVQLMEKLAECCAGQGSYHLATKKYTQAGNKTKAMKALLKSGDTERIVFFAGVSRQKDIYVMAANYLQTLDWRREPEVMKNIISFYTKGRAMESLAGFYDACAQVEIDEYQNYTKALGALHEALKCLGKAKVKNPATLEAKVRFLKERIELVKRFADARSLYEEDPEECMQQCQSLLDEPSLDTAVRTGDIYGLMIEHYGRTGHYEQAYSLMEELRQRIPTVNMAYYVDIRTIEAVHSALGVPLGRGVGAEVLRGSEGAGGGSGEEGSEDSVGEEVGEGY